MAEMPNCVPRWLGEERFQVEPTGRIVFDEIGARFTALAGTGFNPDNPQHMDGSDGLRYAIAIQQLRDRAMFQEADAIRDQVRRFGYRVECKNGETTIIPPWIKGRSA